MKFKTKYTSKKDIYHVRKMLYKKFTQNEGARDGLKVDEGDEEDKEDLPFALREHCFGTSEYNSI